MNDEPKTCLTDGSPVSADHRDINQDTGQQKGYVVLCPEERHKGYVQRDEWVFESVCHLCGKDILNTRRM